MFSNTTLIWRLYLAIFQLIVFRITFRIPIRKENIAIAAFQHKNAFFFGLNLDNN